MEFQETPNLDFIKQQETDNIEKVKEFVEHEKTMENVGYKQCFVEDIAQDKNNSSEDGEENVVEYEQFDKDPSVNFSDDSSDMVPMEAINKNKDESKNKEENQNKENQKKVDMEFEDFEEAEIEDKWSHIKIDHSKVKEAMSKINFDVKPSWQCEK